MIMDGTVVFYKKCLYATIIAPVYIVYTNTSLKGKSSGAKGTEKPKQAYGPQICCTLLSHMQFV